MKILLLILLSVASAVFYRMGGSGNYPRQARMVGCPLTAVLACFVLGIHSWWLVLCMGLMVGAISTYWDFLFKEDNFWVHGFVLGLAMLPLIGVVHWYAILVRAVILALFMGIWCLCWKWDIAEETGRGAAIVASLPLLLI